MIDECLAKMPLQHSQALRLLKLEGMPREAVAEILNVKKQTLAVLLFRAKEELKQCLQSRSAGNEPPAGSAGKERV